MSKPYFLRSGDTVDLDIRTASGRKVYCSTIKPLSDHKAQIIAVNICSRCGGLGSSEAWAHTGYTCYKCAGDGITGTKVVPLYSAEKLEKLNATRDKRRKKQQETLALKRAEEEAARAKMLKETQLTNTKTYPEAIALLITYQGEHTLLSSLKTKYEEGFLFTDKMAAAVIKVSEKLKTKLDFDNHIQHLIDNGTAFTFGRQVLSGFILGVKRHDYGYLGSTLKMMVMDERGFKFYCTVPDEVRSAMQRDEDGDIVYNSVRTFHITLTATLSQGENGFISATRPAKKVTLQTFEAALSAK